MEFQRIAFSNLGRNRRRTLSTLLAIVVGISIIVFVNGFSDGLSGAWSADLINTWRGHLKVRHVEFSQHSVNDPEKIIITDPEGVKAHLLNNPHIQGIMPRVSIGGLLGQEDKSTTFYGAAYDVSVIDEVLPNHGKFVAEGRPLTPEDPLGAVLGKALAESLNVKIGDELVIISRTIYSESSAAVVIIRGLLSIPNNLDLERNLLLTDIEQMRTDLLDMEGSAMELVVRIDDEKNLAEVVQWINNYFVERGMPWEATPWHDDKQFQQVIGIFNSIALIVAVIISLLVGAIISQSLLMAIAERIREIGSLRAIGTGKSDIYKIFYWESVIIIIGGATFGVLLGIGVILIMSNIGIPLKTGSGQASQIYPTIQLTSLFISAGIPAFFSLVAVWFPIKSSCKMEIVDALNYR